MTSRVDNNVHPNIQQEIQARALEIAQKYQDKNRWETAAKNLRAPYWDWASKSVPPPEVVSVDPIKITTPEGEKFVPNPLIKYTFNPIPPSFPSSPYAYKYWKTTIRHPDKPADPNATTDVKALLAYDFTFPTNSGRSHSFFSTKVN